MKTVELQQSVEILRRRIAPARLGDLGGPFKIALVELHQAGGRQPTRHGCGFQNLVIQRHG